MAAVLVTIIFQKPSFNRSQCWARHEAAFAAASGAAAAARIKDGAGNIWVSDFDGRQCGDGPCPQQYIDHCGSDGDAAVILVLLIAEASGKFSTRFATLPVASSIRDARIV